MSYVYYFCGKKTIEKHFRSVIMETYIYLCIFIIILLLYIYSYYKYPQNISILQARPFEFSTNMLLEKQPIVIENNNSNLDDLKKLYFYLNPTQYFNLTSSDIWHKNIYKYTAIQFQSNGEILLCPPNTKMIIDDKSPSHNIIPDPSNTNLLAIQAKVGEIVILPFHWYYYISNKLNVKCLGIHDYITYFLP